MANTLDSRVMTCSTPMYNPSWGRPYQYHMCDIEKTKGSADLQFFIIDGFMPYGHHMVT